MDVNVENKSRNLVHKMMIDQDDENRKPEGMYSYMYTYMLLDTISWSKTSINVEYMMNDHRMAL